MCQRRMIFKMRRLSNEFTRTLFALLLLTMAVLVVSALYLRDPVQSVASISEPSDLYPPNIRTFQIFKELFSNQYETLAVIFNDWTGFAITTREEDQLSVAESFMVEWVEARGKTLADILAIVHNHNDLSRFSKQDDHFYYYLKNQGFDGFFYIYYPHSGKVLAKEKK